jgi:hypothetical protein
MRWLNWRRVVAVIALVVGVGVGMSTTPASADVHTAGAHTNSPPDWWW